LTSLASAAGAAKPTLAATANDNAALGASTSDSSNGSGAAGAQTDNAAAQPASAATNGAALAPQVATADVAAAAANSASAAPTLASSHGAEITAQLAAQIAGKAGSGQSAFAFTLDPQGLGHVDVSLKIDQQGQLSAVLSFADPSTAAEAKSRAADLQQALQQAGFDVSQSGLSFTSGGQGQGQGAAWQTSVASSYGQAAGPGADPSAEAIVSNARAARAASAGGVDITI
jgi:hypothetical protein